MGSKRKKYEPAKGVVALHWKEGTPSDTDRWPVRIAEVWRAYIGYGQREVRVRATIGVLTYDKEAYVWKLDGTALRPDDEIRRHASLGSAWAHISLTVDAWESDHAS